MFRKRFDRNHKILKKMRVEKFELQEEYNESKNVEVKRKIDEITVQIDLFIAHVYGKEIFEYYNKKKPKLVRIKNDQIETWEDVFGDEYELLSKAQQHVLLGLVEGDGKYKFK